MPKKTEISGWGRYPKAISEVIYPTISTNLEKLVVSSNKLCPQGNARSYGDSALGSTVLNCTQLNYFISFNTKTGILVAQSGVMLTKILQHFVHRGWFLPVTPGTHLITLGGAVASDVHGKNQHVAGNFSSFITEITLILANGQTTTCTPTQNPDLFWATCGGMGLTGFIIQVGIRLIPIQSDKILLKQIKSRNLWALFDLFDAHKKATYSVAWIDCLAKGKSFGRSALMLGEHCCNSGFNQHSFNYKPKASVPFTLPAFVLNKLTTATFNELYYRAKKDTENVPTYFHNFFYPLDAVNHWNRIYGPKGFVQYQFVVPFDKGKEAMAIILRKITESGFASFLAVLKTFNQQTEAPLTFPMPGYTLALDLKVTPGLFDLLHKLDKIVLEYGGRVYLTKDARIEKDIFEKMYPKLNTFKDTVLKYNKTFNFESLQSKRLGITIP